MARNRQLNFNAPAPDLEVLNTSGYPLRLSSLWAEKPLLLAFTRHFGCTQCKEMLDGIVSGTETIERSGLDIAIINQGTPQETAVFGRKYAPGLRMLSDPERKAYAAYGLERGDIFQTFLNFKVWAALRRARRKGFLVETPPAGQDAMQMSGMFIINREGRIELPFYYDNIADHPALDLVLNGVLATRWDAPFEGPIGPGVKGRKK